MSKDHLFGDDVNHGWYVNGNHIVSDQVGPGDHGWYVDGNHIVSDQVGPGDHGWYVNGNHIVSDQVGPGDHGWYVNGNQIVSDQVGSGSRSWNISGNHITPSSYDGGHTSTGSYSLTQMYLFQRMYRGSSGFRREPSVLDQIFGYILLAAGLIWILIWVEDNWVPWQSFFIVSLSFFLSKVALDRVSDKAYFGVIFVRNVLSLFLLSFILILIMGVGVRLFFNWYVSL